MSDTFFVNDPQPLLLKNDTWHFYYLINKDYPTGNGTEWNHAISKDLHTWTDQGIAIEKYKTEFGDPWSGVAIIDTDDTAGFGKDTVIAFCSMPYKKEVGQSVARWVSRDSGNTFMFDRMVLLHPSNSAVADAFRDPRILKMNESQSWLMILAEEKKIGFYSSKDLTNWTYVSDFHCDGLGTIECPTLFPISLETNEGDSAEAKWVLLCSANGFASGFTSGTYYWTGSFDGTHFSPDNSEGKWLDYGSDFYATAVSGKDNLNSHPVSSYYAIAWKNNWDYANKVTQAGYYGEHSLVRTITLKKNGSDYSLLNKIIPFQSSEVLHYIQTQLSKAVLDTSKPYSIDTKGASSYIFSASLSKIDQWPPRIDITFQNGVGTPITLILYPDKNIVSLDRSQSGISLESKIWSDVRNAPLDFNASISIYAVMKLKSLELILNDGAVSMTSLVFPNNIQATAQISVLTGTCNIDYVDVTSLS